MSPTRCSADRSRAGITSPAPALNAAYGMPHALAWNIGTTGMDLSFQDRPPLLFAVSVLMACSQQDGATR
jgi:hypothetical protein